MMTETLISSLTELLNAVADSGYAFVPPTPETHRRVNAREGNEQARDLRDIFGWSRPFDRSVLPDRMFGLLERSEMIEQVGTLFRSRVRIASLNHRLYLHSAFPTTAADAVFFGPDTYRFVRSALQKIPVSSYGRVVDLGCGSGAGGLAVADSREVGELCLADINPGSLLLARANAAHAGKMPGFVESDLFSALHGDFDLILSNPPYLADPAQLVYRDGGGPLGMDLSLRLVREGIERLSEAGVLFLYTGVPINNGSDAFRSSVAQIIPPSRFDIDYDEIDPDVFGEELDGPPYRFTDRIAVIALSVRRNTPRAVL